jgi:hypothetical protein
MKQKNLIAAAVAAACAWPLLATAKGPIDASPGHWEVVTPASVDESAPSLTGRVSHLGTGGASTQTQVAAAPAEVITPASVDESAPSLTVKDNRQRTTHVRAASLPNPQTPWSPNESGANRYAEDMQFHADQAAAVEQAQIAAAASHTETAAATETSLEVDRLLVGGSDQPGEPGERETLAVAPALVDSRMPGVTREIEVEKEPSLPPDNMPLQTGDLTAGVTVETGSAETEAQQSTTVQ